MILLAKIFILFENYENKKKKCNLNMKEKRALIKSFQLYFWNVSHGGKGSII